MAKRVTTPKKKAAKKPANPRNNPFNLLDAFWDKPIYKTYNNYERGKFYFILQRRFAINFPEMALMLSLPGINAGQVIKFWQVFITQQIPHKVGWSHWLKMKGAKASAATPSKKYKPSKDLVYEYCKFNDCTVKDIDEAMRLFPTELTKEFKALEKDLK